GLRLARRDDVHHRQAGRFHERGEIGQAARLRLAAQDGEEQDERADELVDAQRWHGWLATTRLTRCGTGSPSAQALSSASITSCKAFGCCGSCSASTGDSCGGTYKAAA